MLLQGLLASNATAKTSDPNLFFFNVDSFSIDV